MPAVTTTIAVPIAEHRIARTVTVEIPPDLPPVSVEIRRRNDQEMVQQAAYTN